MSMGPKEHPQKIEITRFDRVRHEVKKIAEIYFKDPFHYLLIGDLWLTIFGLFLGLNFSWQYWALLLGLISYEIYQKR